MINYYPINLVLKGKRCLVIGAGAVAERKARRLVECGARVMVVSPSITPGLMAMAGKKKISFKHKKFSLRDLSGAYMVIAATTDRSVNASVSSYCLKRGILVNIVDSPKECNFILPSIIRRGALTITISTQGISPALSKKIRKDIENTFGAEYAALLGMVKKIRPYVIKKIKNMSSRRVFFNKMFRPEILDLARRGKGAQAMRKLKKYLDNARI